MRKSRMPVIAGILEVTSWAIPLILLNFLWQSPVWTSKPVIWLLWPLGTLGADLLQALASALYILGGISATAAGILAFMRKLWVLALVSSIGSIIWSPLLGIPATILILRSRDQFNQQSPETQESTDTQALH